MIYPLKQQERSISSLRVRSMQTKHKRRVWALSRAGLLLPSKGCGGRRGRLAGWLLALYSVGRMNIFGKEYTHPLEMTGSPTRSVLAVSEESVHFPSQPRNLQRCSTHPDPVAD